MKAENTSYIPRSLQKVHVHSQHWVYRDKERRRERLRSAAFAESRKFRR
jgi:hypothetical protein